MILKNIYLHLDFQYYFESLSTTTIQSIPQVDDFNCLEKTITDYSYYNSTNKINFIHSIYFNIYIFYQNFHINKAK
jgi:hypothetical protein